MKVAQQKPFLGLDEYNSILECFTSNWVTEGSKSKRLCEKICETVGTKYAVLAPNGTLALYLGLKSLNLEPCEILVPDFTFAASSNAIIMAGHKPIFVDIRKEDLQIDIEKCQKYLTNNTKAIMPVHMYGQSCNMDEVIEFANKNNLLVIEDAAQAFGVKWKNKGCGSFGKVGCFSFFADKSITTGGEGGAVVTNDDEIYQKLLYLRNQGRINRGSFVHPEIGFNFRMTDIQSAVGLCQMEKMDYIFQERLYKYYWYRKELKNVEEISILQPNKDSSYVPFRVILFSPNQQDLSDFMKDKGIESRTLFFPLHKQPCYSYMNYSDEDYKNSINAFETGLCLPCYPSLKKEEVVYISETIKEYFNGKLF